MTRHRSTAGHGETDRADRWYVPLLVAGAVVLVLLLAGLAALEVFVTRVGGADAVRDHAALARVGEALTRRDMAAAMAGEQRSGNGGPRTRSRPGGPVRPDHGG